ncbi:MAG: DUF58 domain-containing protein [Chloroflexi bacterium]|nr:DUF58 domain-containing protein [Chloroflexota bacterium]
MTDKFLTIGAIVLSLLLASLITRDGALALTALPFLAYLGAGFLESPGLEHIRLSARRSLRTTQENGASEIEVRVIVLNEGPGINLVRISDPLQQNMKITQGDLEQWTALGAGQEAQLSYTFQAGRGSYAWDTVEARVSDPLNLIESRLELPAPAEVQVRPRIKKFRPFPLKPESTLHSPGLVPAHTGGSGTDFLGVREYHPGDPLRRMDWRRTARHPHQFFSKEFEQEEVVDIGLILDGRRRADLHVGGDNLFEHTLSATASLAEVLLERGNRVSLLVLGDRLTSVYPGFSKAQLNRILRILAKVEPGSNASPISLEYVPLRMFSSRALIVILSPLSPEDYPIFPRLRARGNQGLLISPDIVAFARATFPNDPPSQLALRVTRLERRMELRKIAQLGVRVIDWQVDQPLPPLIRNILRPARGQKR